ncbi:class I SAM-dependent methyltransferase [Bradyrhizobium sp. Arg237L]|uniref:class I SAM-dependent methyltransferase n=1 Tax=Bradyrhizobium sp. Arg237L TaxID=3003352 RepID=UPI00249EBC1C|nr:class I SAM-dependent methyltransferase [Bradyrhizobium sp. Arg237L]MDI4233413.1 class I SAM-dependent methyltransferase [Bradyrhizobium sp. Arg237L]
MKSVSSLGYKSSEAADPLTYDLVAREYYDESLHPTCADFRLASCIYLSSLFAKLSPKGRVADLGCGRSLIANFQTDHLVLIDESVAMLDQNPSTFERRKLDINREPFGSSEFDWIFAVLGDPYNSPAAWRNIRDALKSEGQCVFVVPSSEWARKFRAESADERPDLARFVTSRGDVVFLRSLIFEPEDQSRMISSVGLTLASFEQVKVRELPYVRSPKIFDVLSADQSLLDVYRVINSG